MRKNIIPHVKIQYNHAVKKLNASGPHQRTLGLSNQLLSIIILAQATFVIEISIIRIKEKPMPICFK